MSITDIDVVNGLTIRWHHSPDKTKSFGFMVGVLQPDNSLTDMRKFDHEQAARNWCNREYVKVDRVGLRTIFKVRVPGELCSQGYATMHDDEPGVYLDHATLDAARKFCGWEPGPNRCPVSVPKSSLPHNRPGYRADIHNSKKG